MSFRLKIACAFACLGMFVQLILVGSSVNHTANIAREQISTQNRFTTEVLGNAVKDALLVYDFGRVTNIVAQMSEAALIRNIEIIDAQGRRIAFAGKPSGPVKISPLLGTDAITSIAGGRIDPERGPLIEKDIVIAGVVLGKVVLAPDLAALNENLYKYLIAELMFGLLGAVFVAVVAWFASGALVRRIVSLDSGAARIADGDFNHRVNIGGNDEIFRTAETINRMADALISDKTALEEQAQTDGLTGLLNRSGLSGRFARLVRQGRAVSALHIDLDRFKMVNDTRGHSAGDAVLKAIAQRLRALAPKDALVARIGGDEFAMILEEDNLGVRSIECAETCISEASRPVEFRGMKLAVGASVGIAHRPGGQGFEDSERLLADADIALYQAKNNGRGQVALFDSTARAALEAEANLEFELALGLEYNEFIPYLQPQIDAVSGSVVGAEVLARWNSPKRGVLTPGNFLQSLQNPELEERITYAVRGAALDWMGAGEEGRPPVISINLAATELARVDCASDLQWELALRKIPPSRIAVEVLEDVVIREGDTEIERTISALRAAGHPLELDDFGTGNSGLVNLVRLSVEQLKIDRRFIMGIDGDKSRQAIVEAMVGIGRALNIRVLAEGVETEAEKQALIELGCNRMQGYLFAYPMALEDFEQWVAGRSLAA